MSRKVFEVVYPDGSKKHVSRAERDDLVLAGLAHQIAPQKYRFIGQQRTMHSFAELGSINFGFEPANLKRFLAGQFVFEYKGRRSRELMETPECLAMRVSEQSA